MVIWDVPACNLVDGRLRIGSDCCRDPEYGCNRFVRRLGSLNEVRGCHCHQSLDCLVAETSFPKGVELHLMLHHCMRNVEQFQSSFNWDKHNRQCACLGAAAVCPSSHAKKKKNKQTKGSLDSGHAAFSFYGNNVDCGCSITGC